jgi:hypothetical protein
MDIYVPTIKSTDFTDEIQKFLDFDLFKIKKVKKITDKYGNRLSFKFYKTKGLLNAIKNYREEVIKFFATRLNEKNKKIQNNSHTW